MRSKRLQNEQKKQVNALEKEQKYSASIVDIEDILKKGISEKYQEHGTEYHQFSKVEIGYLQQKLLAWYNTNHRVLPWRTTPQFSQQQQQQQQQQSNKRIKVEIENENLNGNDNDVDNDDDEQQQQQQQNSKRIKVEIEKETLDDDDQDNENDNDIAFVDNNNGDKSFKMYSHINRAYAVWISEVMCQQTQVATVVNYYHKWMEKFPSVNHLARASIEDVNKVWSGLGYYSRAKRLRDAAVQIVEDLNGIFPTSAAELMRLPGVGQYTANAVASIAYNEKVGVVDGNVMRVLSRLRSIGANIREKTVTSLFWNIANNIVDNERPGDFNQALMELGATVCNPKTPSCSICPIQSVCRAKAEKDFCCSNNSGKSSIKKKKNNLCEICGDLDSPQEQVINYPFKSKGKESRKQSVVVCIITNQDKLNKEKMYLIKRRPSQGLLAGLWEFPSVDLVIDDVCGTSSTTGSKGGKKGGGVKNSESHSNSIEKKDKSNNPMIEKILKDGVEKVTYSQRKKITDNYLKEKCHVIYDNLRKNKCARNSVGSVLHVFSHIQNTYLIELWENDITMENENFITDLENWKWVPESQLKTEALSTAMRKVLKIHLEPKNENKPNSKSKKPKVQPVKGKASILGHFKQ